MKNVNRATLPLSLSNIRSFKPVANGKWSLWSMDMEETYNNARIVKTDGNVAAAANNMAKSSRKRTQYG